MLTPYARPLLLLARASRHFDEATPAKTERYAVDFCRAVPACVLRFRPLTPDDAIEVYAAFLTRDFSHVGHAPVKGCLLARQHRSKVAS